MNLSVIGAMANGEKLLLKEWASVMIQNKVGISDFYNQYIPTFV